MLLITFFTKQLFVSTNKQVLPKVIWEECVATPHIGECTHPLHMLAVACTMHNKALWSITELLRNVTEPLRKISLIEF